MVKIIGQQTYLDRNRRVCQEATVRPHREAVGARPSPSEDRPDTRRRVARLFCPNCDHDLCPSLAGGHRRGIRAADRPGSLQAGRPAKAHHAPSFGPGPSLALHARRHASLHDRGLAMADRRGHLRATDHPDLEGILDHLGANHAETATLNAVHLLRVACGNVQADPHLHGKAASEICQAGHRRVTAANESVEVHHVGAVIVMI